MTDAEEKWRDFIEKEIENAGEDLIGYISDRLPKSLISTAFAIVVVLPLRKEIKLDLEELENKIGATQESLGIFPKLRCNWQCTARDLELRIEKLT